MAYAVIMPKAGMAMETGKVIKWLKNVGERVEQGEPLLEIETDKVNMEVEAMNSGVLLHALAREGDEVPVVRTIGFIGAAGESVPETEIAAALAAMKVAAKHHRSAEPMVMARQAGERIPATPAAKRLAKERGLSLSDIAPSGSFGQIKAADVAPANVISFAPEEAELVPHSAMRRVIAQRTLSSWQHVPQVTQTTIADVSELLALRERINAAGGIRVTVNDFVLAAAAQALREQPRINASYTDAGLLLKKHVNIGMAVALPDGLVVPVIRDADALTLREVSAAAKALRDKAEKGHLLPDDCTGGTFTVSNLGMLGVASFTPIINEPESAILGVCAVEQRLEMDDEGRVTKRLKLPLCLTYDHRSVDGAQAAVFAARIAHLLESPLLLADVDNEWSTKS